MSFDNSITSRNVMLKFLILSTMVCFALSAPQVYDNGPNELDRSKWTEDRILRAQMGIERNIRIVGGSAAQPNQFRHVAALFLKLIGQESFCGGSIIHVNFILTAAHCLDDLISIDVSIGAINIFRGNPIYRATVLARDTRQHPSYDKGTLRDDIGLLCLRSTIPNHPQIAPVALPPRAWARTNLITRNPPSIIGWGRTTDASQSLSGSLQYAQLSIIEDRHCENVYNTVFNYFNPATNICISGTQGSTCNGDSGGSATVVERGNQILIGIVSYGSSTCENGHPVALTRVTSYLDWISSMTNIRIV